MTARREHFQRPQPRWRELLPDAPTYTECGRRIADTTALITRDTYTEQIAALTSKARALYRGRIPDRDIPAEHRREITEHGLDVVCHACRDRADLGSDDWDTAPAAVLARESTLKVAPRLEVELRALEQMALADPEKFAELFRREQAFAAFRGPRRKETR